MKRKIILTAFEPFGDRNINVSSEVLKNVQKTSNLETLVLPVVFSDFKQKLAYMKRLSPDYIFSLGESKRQKPDMENKARNLIQCEGKLDNEGKLIENEPVIKDAPRFYLSTLPNSKIIGHVKNNGYEIKLSDDAGLYVCNFVFYKILHEFNNSKTKVGFMHLPRDEDINKMTDLTYLITDFLENGES